jgi:2-aminoadipate transaminase
LKQGADLHTSTFNQMVIHEVAKDGFIDKHIATLRTVYRQRRDVMLDAMTEFMPEGVRWTHPQGGLFLWVSMPDEVDMQTLFDAAIERNVAFVPGFAFYTSKNPPPTGRLNFSNMGEAMIVEGIRRLSDAIKESQRAAKPIIAT